MSSLLPHLASTLIVRSRGSQIVAFVVRRAPQLLIALGRGLLGSSFHDPGGADQPGMGFAFGPV